MAALIEFRDARRDYNQALALTKHEERFGGLRSLAIFTVMSAVLVGVMLASLAA